jgi:hypothetical protein
MVERWTTEYTKMVERHIPKRTIRVEDGNKMWKTEEIEDLNLEKEKNMKMKNINTHRHIQKCNRIKMRLKRAIIREKQRYDEHLNKRIHETTGEDNKTWWKLVKQFYHKNRNTSADDPPLVVGGKETESDAEKVAAFNTYFASVASMQNVNSLTIEETDDAESTITKVTVT